ncbi:hypothetical protein OPT61_g85 [Boeremia exigua]|uniref:Uncharacterized protein n=1 Tax=Boeremia exigua TaxID=749465 RepID=A0ACC2IV93_9PLEO|nr:hypothetical protein OPT61_g85 [Boeremia exigua]
MGGQDTVVISSAAQHSSDFWSHAVTLLDCFLLLVARVAMAAVFDAEEFCLRCRAVILAHLCGHYRDDPQGFTLSCFLELFETGCNSGVSSPRSLDAPWWQSIIERASSLETSLSDLISSPQSRTGCSPRPLYLETINHLQNAMATRHQAQLFPHGRDPAVNPVVTVTEQRLAIITQTQTLLSTLTATLTVTPAPVTSTATVLSTTTSTTTATSLATVTVNLLVSFRPIDICKGTMLTQTLPAQTLTATLPAVTQYITQTITATSVSISTSLSIQTLPAVVQVTTTTTTSIPPAITITSTSTPPAVVQLITTTTTVTSTPPALVQLVTTTTTSIPPAIVQLITSTATITSIPPAVVQLVTTTTTSIPPAVTLTSTSTLPVGGFITRSLVQRKRSCWTCGFSALKKVYELKKSTETSEDCTIRSLRRINVASRFEFFFETEPASSCVYDELITITTTSIPLASTLTATVTETQPPILFTTITSELRISTATEVQITTLTLPQQTVLSTLSTTSYVPHPDLGLWTLDFGSPESYLDLGFSHILRRALQFAVQERITLTELTTLTEISTRPAVTISLTDTVITTETLPAETVTFNGTIYITPPPVTVTEDRTLQVTQTLDPFTITRENTIQVTETLPAETVTFNGTIYVTPSPVIVTVDNTVRETTTLEPSTIFQTVDNTIRITETLPASTVTFNGTIYVTPPPVTVVENSIIRTTETLAPSTVTLDPSTVLVTPSPVTVTLEASTTTLENTLFTTLTVTQISIVTTVQDSAIRTTEFSCRDTTVYQTTTLQTAFVNGTTVTRTASEMVQITLPPVTTTSLSTIVAVSTILLKSTVIDRIPTTLYATKTLVENSIITSTTTELISFTSTYTSFVDAEEVVTSTTTLIRPTTYTEFKTVSFGMNEYIYDTTTLFETFTDTSLILGTTTEFRTVCSPVPTTIVEYRTVYKPHATLSSHPSLILNSSIRQSSAVCPPLATTFFRLRLLTRTVPVTRTTTVSIPQATVTTIERITDSVVHTKTEFLLGTTTRFIPKFVPYTTTYTPPVVYVTSIQTLIKTSVLPASILTSTWVFNAPVSTSIKTLFIGPSSPARTVTRTISLPPRVSMAYRILTLPASTITTTSVLPAATKSVTRTLCLAHTKRGSSQKPGTVGPKSSSNAQAPATLISTATTTTTLVLSGAIVTSTAFLPERTVSITRYHIVTTVLTQRETLNPPATSSLVEKTTTHQVFTTTSPQAISTSISTAFVGPAVTEVPHIQTVTATHISIRISRTTATVRDTTTIFSALLVYTTVTDLTIRTAPGPYISTSTILRSLTNYRTVKAWTTRTIFATQISVITSTRALSTSIVWRPTTIYSTNLIPTTFTLTSTALSVIERGFTTTIFTGRTVTTTVTAEQLNLPIRAEPTQILPSNVKPSYDLVMEDSRIAAGADEGADRLSVLTSDDDLEPHEPCLFLGFSPEDWAPDFLGTRSVVVKKARAAEDVGTGNRIAAKIVVNNYKYFLTPHRVLEIHPAKISSPFKMVQYANFLFPLYVYPINNAWEPLTFAAAQYPDVTFTAVINPSTGPAPDANGCPNKDYVEAIHALNQYPNIHTMGYVHTANRWDCGSSGTDICFCTAPAADVKANITTYASWKTKGCEGWSTQNPDIHIDSIFIDEAPGTDGGNCLSYMTDLTNHAKSSLTTASGGEVLFNAGAQTELSYFDVADVVILFENTQAEYEAIPDIGVRNGNGQYHAKSSIIIHSASNATNLIQRDTSTILGLGSDAFHSMFYTDRSSDHYAYFPYDWAQIVEEVNAVAQANKAILGA